MDTAIQLSSAENHHLAEEREDRKMGLARLVEVEAEQEPECQSICSIDLLTAGYTTTRQCPIEHMPLEVHEMSQSGTTDSSRYDVPYTLVLPSPNDTLITSSNEGRSEQRILGRAKAICMASNRSAHRLPHRLAFYL